MATIRIEAQLTADQLFQALQQLPPKELERLLARASQLRVQRRPATRRVSRREKELLPQATATVPEDIMARYRALRDKMRAGNITQPEHQQMLALIQEMEAHNVARIKALAGLADLRQQSLDSVMADLGIKPPEYE